MNVVDRIKKLLNLAAANPFENEASAAISEARRLMEKHDVSEADLGADVGVSVNRDGITEISLGADGFMNPWKFPLASSVCKTFYCRAIGLRVGDRRKVRVVGRYQDAQIAVAVFRFAAGSVRTMSDRIVKNLEKSILFKGEVGDSDLKKGVEAYRESFETGAVVGMIERLRQEMEDLARRNPRAVVPYRRGRSEVVEYAENRFGAQRETARVPDAVAEEDSFHAERAYAYMRGYIAGSRVNVYGEVKKERRQP